jgi:hypothetical protein
MVELKELLNIYKQSELDSFLKEQGSLTLNEDTVSEEKIRNNWKFVGDNSSSGSTISIVRHGEKALVERITNGIDAVIEKQKDLKEIVSPTKSSDVIKKAFPKYYENATKAKAGESDSIYSYDADNQVVLAINDASKSSLPTFDIVDKGTGISGADFPDTILSINKGNKIKREKSYLIGAFGQGGSTSLPFAKSTIIISKKDGKYYYTIVRAVSLIDYKTQSYVFWAPEGAIQESSFSENYEFGPDYLNDFVNSPSGTLVRMIETDVSTKFRQNDISKPGMLGDYINTELFSVELPVKIVENRKNFTLLSSSQNRNAYGSFLKMQTSKYVQKDYSGSISIDHNERSYHIDFYVILPKDENDWGSDSKSESSFQQFNVYGDPIIYTVNGQTITTESFIKIKNAGLSFMRYRLLIVINLDVLGSEKYKFFTSDRAQIKDTDLTHGFLDKVIAEISNVEKLKQINSIIAQKSINQNIDNDAVNEIAGEVKNIYHKYLKGGNVIPGRASVPSIPGPEKAYLDHIEIMDVSASKFSFYRDENINVILTTNAEKHINSECQSFIYCYVNGKSFYQSTPICQNGRIQYSISAGVLQPGTYTVQFVYFKNNSASDVMKSNTISFEVLHDKIPEDPQQAKEKALDLHINIVNDKNLICDIEKNLDEKTITANLCLDNDPMRAEIYGAGNSVGSDEIKDLQRKIIKPVVLFALFLDESYDNLATDEDRNKHIIAFIRSFVSATSINR